MDAIRKPLAHAKYTGHLAKWIVFNLNYKHRGAVGSRGQIW